MRVSILNNNSLLFILGKLSICFNTCAYKTQTEVVCRDKLSVCEGVDDRGLVDSDDVGWVSLFYPHCTLR